MGVKGITHVELDATQRNMFDGVACLSRDENAAIRVAKEIADRDMADFSGFGMGIDARAIDMDRLVVIRI